MRTFKDNSGRTWTVELNVHQMKRIRARLGVDLVDILWVCVEEEAKAAGVTDEQFGRSLAGDSIETATAAFLDELVDFFPGARRLFLKKAVDLARKYTAETKDVLAKALEDPELTRRVEESMRSSASSPESSV